MCVTVYVKYGFNLKCICLEKLVCMLCDSFSKKLKNTKNKSCKLVAFDAFLNLNDSFN